MVEVAKDGGRTREYIRSGFVVRPDQQRQERLVLVAQHDIHGDGRQRVEQPGAQLSALNPGPIRQLEFLALSPIEHQTEFGPELILKSHQVARATIDRMSTGLNSSHYCASRMPPASGKKNKQQKKKT